MDYVKGLGSDAESPNDVYISGIVTEVTEAFGTQYGNATFKIADVENGKTVFTFYRGLYLGNVKYSDASAPNVNIGDKVVICGRVIYYKGTTPETSQGKAYVVSINGTGGGDTPTPGGDAKAVSVADFLAAAVSTTDWYQLTGTIKNLKDGDEYGNFDIEDATGSVYVYGLLAEKGGEKKKFQELVAAKGIANGKKITIIGNRGEFKESAQVANAYFVKIEDGEGGGGGTGEGDGTEAKPYDVAGVVAAGSGTNVFVKAYIVGWVDGQVLASGAHFDANATAASNILIADSPDETNVAKCIPVQLPSGAVRNAVNLKDNAGNYKKEVLLVGNIEKYFGTTGLKGTSYAKIGDTETGTKPGGGTSGGGGDTGSDILNVSFASGQGDFTIEDKELGSLTYVWKADTKGYMKASAYANNTNNAAESWLISPAFSLKNATAPVMTFNNACNYVKEGTITDHIKVMVYDGTNWTEATIASLPDGASWTFVDSTVDLKAFAGKENVKVAFKYVSTTAVAPTWEIKTVTIK